MSNKNVIAIFIIGVALLLGAFWAGLKVTKEPLVVTQVDAKTIAQSEAPSTVGVEAPGAAPRYVVLVGTFGSKEKADQLTAELKRQSYKSAYTQSPARGGDDSLYRVFIGPYEKPEEADRVANELASSGRKGVMIKPQR